MKESTRLKPLSHFFGAFGKDAGKKLEDAIIELRKKGSEL